ncbi:MAG: flagellar basal-body rod protein FlgG [Deltaproteobacteria bacterium]|nr:flagellar basal-body rod protein FlgG [Deltaproteobacteria bacterium]
MIRSLRTAASGMEAQQLNIDVIANNLANVNTVGFKRSRAEFQDLFYEEIRSARDSSQDQAEASPMPLEVGQGTRAVATQKLFGQGALQATNNELDVAIEGAGFFRIQMADGTNAYTRNGAFTRDKEGRLVTLEGQTLDPPIILPEDTQNVIIENDGTVKSLQVGTVEPIEVGRIGMTLFINPSGLESQGHNLYAASEGSGEPIDGFPGEEGFGGLGQGMLEGSNVEVVEEMIDLIAAQRAYEINSRVIQAADQMLQETTRLR